MSKILGSSGQCERREIAGYVPMISEDIGKCLLMYNKVEGGKGGVRKTLVIFKFKGLQPTLVRMTSW